MAIINSNPLVGTTPVAVYTSSGTSAITFMSLCNTTALPVVVDVHVVPNGQAVGLPYLLFNHLTIAAEDTFEVYHAAEKLILNNGDAIYVTSDAAASVASLVSYTGV